MALTLVISMEKSKALGYKNITLPKGHTWESYTKFLLLTLPKKARDGYVSKFKTSLKFWHTIGGGLEEITIKELVDRGYKIKKKRNFKLYSFKRITNYIFRKNT